MKIDVLTLFPRMFEGPMGESIIGKAVDKGLLDINISNFRDYSDNKHQTVDDYPYGGMREKVVWGNVNEKKSSNRSALFIFLVFSYRFATFYMGKCCCTRCGDIRPDPRKRICGF
ncbi:hypothetical protein EfmAA610_19750 [Enterococcus faecium]|nr:hypothetical protein EfmAA610_19750 [Enterococcus faecium]